MLYRTEDLTRWGAGKSSNLEPGEIDGNFWELAERLVPVEASAGEAANGIANIGVVGSQVTVYLKDGTVLGPYTLPVAMIHYRGDWTAATSYAELDLVAVSGAGIYLVLQDHVLGATFDALAVGADSQPLYRWLFPIGTVNAANVSDEGVSVAASPSDINFVGDGVIVTADGDGTVTVTIPGGGAGGTLDGLSDVAITTPAAGDVIRFNGTGFVNGRVAWGEITGVPATFAPSPHVHGWSEITGRPATVDALPATVGPNGRTLKALDGAIVWATDDTGGGGGGSVAVSDEGTQVLSAPTDLNFVGDGVTVTDDGDGSLTIPIPGGGGSLGGALDDLSDVAITSPATGQVVRFNGSAFVNAALGWAIFRTSLPPSRPAPTRTPGARSPAFRRPSRRRRTSIPGAT